MGIHVYFFVLIIITTFWSKSNGMVNADIVGTKAALQIKLPNLIFEIRI